MGINFLILLLIAGLVILFGWLTRRAWRTPNPFLKWVGSVIGGLFTLIALLIGSLGTIGLVRYFKTSLMDW